jgi:hypothetical protein
MPRHHYPMRVRMHMLDCVANDVKVREHTMILSSFIFLFSSKKIAYWCSFCSCFLCRSLLLVVSHDSKDKQEQINANNDFAFANNSINTTEREISRLKTRCSSKRDGCSTTNEWSFSAMDLATTKNKPKSDLSIAPLVLKGLAEQADGDTIAWCKTLRYSTQSEHQHVYTLYASDVKTFNLLLEGASRLSISNERAATRRTWSVQRLLDTNEDAFVSQIDLDIDDDQIRTKLISSKKNVQWERKRFIAHI